ncbi:MAG: CidA/LrgA family protein [Terrisporobacter sp.]|uniref:CidA/LrgA family protein n=1 Tax=Terrisporobacter sp. TaxID=1965305 RepID=UPI002FCAF695
MKIFNQLGIILGIWASGELISSLFSSIIKLPGTIVGMIILFLLLQFKVIKEETIKGVSDFLLNNMAIFFVPAGVSLIQSLGLIKDNILVLVLTSTIATVIIMLATGKTVDLMISKKALKNKDDISEDDRLA